MGDTRNEAQRIAGDLRNWIQQPEHGPLMWMRDAIPPRRVAEFADRIESLGESDARTDAPAEVWAVMEHGLSIVYEIHLSEESAAAGAARLTGKMRIKKYPVHGSTQDAGEGEKSSPQSIGEYLTAVAAPHAETLIGTGVPYFTHDGRPCPGMCSTQDAGEGHGELNRELENQRILTKSANAGWAATERARDSHKADLDAANKRIAELEAVVERLKAEYTDAAKHVQMQVTRAEKLEADLQRLRSVILCIRRMAWDALGPDMTLAKIKANVAAIHNATEADPSEALRPDPEPSDALARATEAMDRLPHETVILGRINHLGTAIGAIIYHLKGGKP